MISEENLKKRRKLSGYYNLTCPVCGKQFHRKPCYLSKRVWEKDICCSSDCSREIKRIKMSGAGNHQYGLKGQNNASFLGNTSKRKNRNLQETMVYVGDWYVKNNWSGRVPEHRYLVELNHDKFDAAKFEKIGTWFYLKDEYHVHHMDFDHNNNSLDNLLIVTRSEHTRIHNKERRRKRL